MSQANKDKDDGASYESYGIVSRSRSSRSKIEEESWGGDACRSVHKSSAEGSEELGIRR